MTTRTTLHSINLVLSGKREIWIDRTPVTVKMGDVYFLPATASIEAVPNEADFQEQTFLFSPSDLQEAVFRSISLYGNSTEISPKASIRYSYAADFGIKTFFNTWRLYGAGLSEDTPHLSQMKLNELLNFMTTSRQKGAPEVLYTIFRQIDREECQFKAIISAHIFENLTIEELATLTHKSMTAFKSCFQRIFDETPHRWILKQRLQHARMLVTTTRQPISRIGDECRFDNISHFIKLFKREFGKTPLALRQELTKKPTR